MAVSETRIKDEMIHNTTFSSTIDHQESDEHGTGKDKIVNENLHEVVEEVQSNVTKFTSKLPKIDDTSETSSDSEAVEEPEKEINLETCSVRVYIEHTVGQLLLAALTILERERPENPIKWLAEFLLFHKDRPLVELIGEPPEQEIFEPIKLPEHVKKVIIEDLKDLDIEVVNKLV